MANVRVNISLSPKDLQILDAKASQMHLDRSSYIVYVCNGGTQRPVVYYNEDNYEVCKKVFKLENPQHMVNYALALLAKQAYERLQNSQESSYEETTLEIE